MDDLHQSSIINPAYQNPYNGYLGAPAISNLYLNVVNSGFDFDDFIHSGEGLYKDSLIMDFNNVLSKVGKSNYSIAIVNIPVLSIGFWVRDSYFTFSFTNKSLFRLGYPKDFVKLIEGNTNNIGNNNPLKVDNVGPFCINYNEYAFGFAKQITHRLTIGGKFKLLSGIASLESRESDFTLYTQENSYELQLATKLRYNLSGPFKYSYDQDGLIEDIEFDDSNPVGSALSFKNMGVGIDLGASYQFNDELKLYASVIDLGFISWKESTVNLSQSGTFEFSGFNLDSLWTDTEYDEFEELMDSLGDFFKFAETESKFNTFLNTSVYLGATYEVSPYVNFGLLSKTFFFDRKIHEAVTLSANFSPVKWFTGSISYSAMYREYRNLGLGFGIRGGALQFFAATDNILGCFAPKKFKTVGVQFGLNLYFGRDKRDNFSLIKSRKPQKDVDFM